ncbi:protein containing Phage terminase large subunit domain protein, partial [gut metagenome]
MPRWVWAIEKMGLTDEYDLPESTLRIRKRSTGQLILFRGCDNPQKLKSIKVPFGEIGIVWIEEADQFSGMAEIRMVLQS